MLNYLTLTLGLLLLSLTQCNTPTPFAKLDDSDGLQSSISWEVNQDGSFSVKSDSLSITNFYPHIDGAAIRPLSFIIKPNKIGATISYELSDKRFVEIVLASDSHSLTLSSSLKGFKVLPEYFCPAGSGEMIGVDRLVKQGLGFGGPSAIIPMPKSSERVDLDGLHEHVWSYDSYLTSGIINERNYTMTWGAYDHKEFIQRTTFYNKQTRFGLIDRWEALNKELIDIGFSTENMLPSSQIQNLPTIHIVSGKVPFQTFQNFAMQLANHNKIKLKQPPAYHWCSWYDTEKDFNEALLNEILDGLAKMNPKIPIQTIQIDDGYFSYYGDWLKFDSLKFPSGFGNCINKIKDQGYRSGIWISPFMVHEKSELFKSHPEWILHHPDGTLVIEWDDAKNGKTYILDTSQPEAFEYIRKVFRTLKSLGISYFKTDFMDWGLKNSIKYKRYSPGKSSAQYFNEVLEMIRQEIGEESFWLGCIMPFPQAVGYVDAIRNSNDVGKKWSTNSHGNMINESIITQYTNNILWQLDPDVLYMNSFKTELTKEECYTLALFDGMLGGVINTSDRFHKMSDESLLLWRFIQPSSNYSSAEIPMWGQPSDLKVLLRRFTNQTGVLLFTNDTEKKIVTNYKVFDLIKMPSKHFFEWKPSISNYIGLKQELSLELQPHQSILLYFSDEQVAPSKDLGLYGLKTLP
ncbi:MAG: alpha-galactosidase [Cytophagales bacterium]|nr:MAG: alpha-galactosidase [Cytophagales bacterium]